MLGRSRKDAAARIGSPQPEGQTITPADRSAPLGLSAERRRVSRRFVTPREDALGAIGLGLGVVIALSTLAMVILAYDPLPYSDQWNNLVAGRAITWDWLVAQHNEHRLLFPRLIFLADHVVADEANLIDLGMNLALVASGAALFAWLAKRLGRLARPAEARMAAGVILGLMFSAMQLENFTWGFQVQFFGVCTLAVASFSVLALTPPSSRSLAGVILIETIAVYTLSSGLIVAILAPALAVRLRRPRTHLVALAAAAAVLAAAYLHGYETPGAHADPTGALNHLPIIVAFALAELGQPVWSLVPFHSPWPAIAFGAVGIVLFGRAALRLWRRTGTPRPAEAALFTIMAFALAMAMVTALGRWTFGLDQAVVSRYATPMLLFWLSLLLSAAADRSRGTTAGHAVMTAGLVILTLLLVNQPRFIVRALRAAISRSAATPAILAGVADRAVLDRIHPSPDVVLEGAEALKQDGASVFKAPWTHWLGTPMPGAETSATLPGCDGEVRTLTAIDDASHPGWRVTGRVRGLAGRLVLVDPARTVVGYGLMGFDAKAVGEPPGAESGGDWWIGAFGAVDPAAVTAYGLRADDTPRCALGPLRPGR